MQAPFTIPSTPAVLLVASDIINRAGVVASDASQSRFAQKIHLSMPQSQLNKSLKAAHKSKQETVRRQKIKAASETALLRKDVRAEEEAKPSVSMVIKPYVFRKGEDKAAWEVGKIIR